LAVPNRRYGLFPRKPLRGAVNGMTWPPCSIGSGSQIVPVIKSIHILRGGVLGINQRYYAEYPEQPYYRTYRHHRRYIHYRHHRRHD
jgi:hypothetical protein